MTESVERLEALNQARTTETEWPQTQPRSTSCSISARFILYTYNIESPHYTCKFLVIFQSQLNQRLEVKW